MNEIYQIAEILKSGELSGFRAAPEYHLGGRFVRALEDKFCEYFGVKYAIALNSATSTLHASLIACDIHEGDEVIVSPYSFSSSASCVLMVGAKPVFADIQDDIFCINPLKVLITPRTKAIIPVHLCGHPAKMNEIMVLAEWGNLYVIEDAAQAIGATYRNVKAGALGHCGIFSFNQSKHINAGEGGMLITNDDEIARKVRAVRNHGEVSDPDLKLLGYNYRMTEVVAAIANERFKSLDKSIQIRIDNAVKLTEALSQIKGLTPPITYAGCRHVFCTYAIKFNKDIIGMHRDEFQDKMMQRGIYFGKGYVKPLYLLPIYEQFGYKEGLCPVAERMYREELLVTDIVKDPDLDIEAIVKAIKDVLQ